MYIVHRRRQDFCGVGAAWAQSQGYRVAATAGGGRAEGSTLASATSDTLCELNVA